jgi:arylsulfatase
MGGQDKPNILLMMVDDLGFSDFGCYGSEIETPHIDKLADQGIRFTQFYNTAKCHSSRVSLMTGLYCNQAGNLSLSRGVTIADLLRDAGYATSMTGKWHLDDEPTDHGFDRYFGHLSGLTDCFAGDDTFRLNGEKWDDFDPDFYMTDANVDYSMDFIDEAMEQGKPFFHYIAFNAPHFPLQAKKEDIQKYLNTYDVGWDVIRDSRFKKQKQLGLFPEDMELPELPGHMQPWTKLSDHEREMESFRMAVYSAMVDSIDQNIGRLLDYLKKKGQLDNTLIMLCSDNGACPFERSEHVDIPPWEAGSYYVYDSNWATVGNTPLKHYKQTAHEGGITTPFIVNWPSRLKNTGTWVDEPSHLIDVMATCTDLADTSYPEKYNGKKIEPLMGKSLLPVFKGIQREGHDYLYFQYSNCRGIRQGDWKAVSFYGHDWELYNLSEDRVEQNNLAHQHPEKVKVMSELWHEVAKETDLLKEKFRLPENGKPATNTHDNWHTKDEYDDWTMPVLD